MEIRFPESFIFGTSTSAYQIETAFQHDWSGHPARDGHVFHRTTDHEKNYEEDARIIAGLAPAYRMSLMWSRLQHSPYAPLHEETREEYRRWLQHLTDLGVDIMMVLHHFANPLWFANAGGWANRNNIGCWVDYARKVVDEYGQFISLWNTFNEPNLYASMAWLAGEFPPFKKNLLLAKKVIDNMSDAHRLVYAYIKSKYPHARVGISHNCAVFAPDNFFGRLPAWLVDALYMEWAPSRFSEIDFFGMSYYARIGYDPLPSTYLLTPEKLERSGKRHDDIWEYYPEGMAQCITRYWKQYNKPIIITENGICTKDDRLRICAIHDYLNIIHRAIGSGIDVQGYYHWTAWDNFEWSIGPTYQFGLYGCDLQSKKRFKKPSADLFASIAHSRALTSTRSD